MMSGNYTSIENQNVPGSVPAVADSPPHTAVKFAGSSLQTFPPSGTQGKISGAAQPPRDADDSFGKPVPVSDEPQQGGWFRIFTIAAYRPYFDVDTSDVLERIKDSLFPFKGSFSEKTADNPDLFIIPTSKNELDMYEASNSGIRETTKSEEINTQLQKRIPSLKPTWIYHKYGPFWICTTLIFVAASIGTFVTYIAHKVHQKEWDYDINLMTWSAGLFYGYVSIVPLALYLFLKYFSVPTGFVHLLCLYGYSLFVFIPAMCLSVIPQEIVRWVVAGVAGFMSASFVALNLRNHIKSAGESWFIIVAGIFLLQLALALVLKLYLFTVSV